MPIFAVTLGPGPMWQGTVDPANQVGEVDHAAFMQKLLQDRFLLFGGPLRDSPGNRALLVVVAPSQELVRSRLTEDPWMRSGVLDLVEVRGWDVRYGELV